LVNITHQTEKSLTPNLLALIKDIGQLAASLQYNVYMVGGSVRDILLNRPTVDIDIVVEGDAIVLTRSLSKSLIGQAKTHPRFGTAKLSTGNMNVDMVSARSETYEKPGALPTIKPGLVKDDLARRDFTINAMAASIAPDSFGELVDCHNGLIDIKSGVIRILHPNSFTDDATRIFRAIRYEQRLGFKIEPDTEALIKRDIAMIDTISGDRLRHELELIFNEELTSTMLKRAGDLGVLRQLHPSLKDNGWLGAKLNEACKQETDYNPTMLFSLLTYNLKEEECKDTLKRLNIAGKNGQIIKEVQKAKKELGALSVPNLSFSRIYRTLENFSNEAIGAIIMAEEPSIARQRLELYIEKLQKIRPIFDGNDLKKMGITTGRKIGSILKQLLNAKLDQKVRTKSDEQKLVKSLVRGDKP